MVVKIQTTMIRIKTTHLDLQYILYADQSFLLLRQIYFTLLIKFLTNLLPNIYNRNLAQI